jgi:hypothetical protein
MSNRNMKMLKEEDKILIANFLFLGIESIKNHSIADYDSKLITFIYYQKNIAL